jgi:hypothetical protein
MTLGQEGFAGDIFRIQHKGTLLKYQNSTISSIGTQLSLKHLSLDFLDQRPYFSVLVVVCMVVSELCGDCILIFFLTIRRQ